MWKWIKEHIFEIYAGILLLCGSIFGGYQALAYWIPLGDHEKDLHKAFAGLQVFLMCISLALMILLFKLLMDWLFRKMDQKYGNIEKYVSSDKWPKQEKRTLQHTLIYMNGKVMLLTWDIIQGCGMFAMLLTCLCVEDIDKWTWIGALLQMFFYAAVVHGLIWLYYWKKDYRSKMLKYTEKYLGTVNKESFLAHLERDLQEHVFVYSKMLILTTDFIMGWGETEVAFHPVAIPKSEIACIKFRVSEKWFGYGKRSIAPVIVCELQNKNIVEIFAGGRFQIEVMQQLLIRFAGDKWYCT